MFDFVYIEADSGDGCNIAKSKSRVQESGALNLNICSEGQLKHSHARTRLDGSQQ